MKTSREPDQEPVPLTQGRRGGGTPLNYLKNKIKKLVAGLNFSLQKQDVHGMNIHFFTFLNPHIMARNLVHSLLEFTPELD